MLPTQTSPLFSGTQDALVPGAAQATPGQTWVVQPAAAQAAARGSSALLSFTQAWQPLARKTALLADPLLAEIGARHGVTPAQVVLRWHLQRGAVPIPKSATPSRQRENLDVFGFQLSDAELEAIVDRPQARGGADPDDPALT